MKEAERWMEVLVPYAKSEELSGAMSPNVQIKISIGPVCEARCCAMVS